MRKSPIALTAAVAAVLAVSVATVPALAAAPGPSVATDPTRPSVVDEVVMVGTAPEIPEGQRILGRVREVDEKAGKLWVVVNWGDSEGPVSVPLERVRRVDYDVAGRRAELPAGDKLARYKFALWLISVGLRAEALADLEAVAGNGDVPDEVWKLLAAIQEEGGLLRPALVNYKRYLQVRGNDVRPVPADADVRAVVKRLEEKVAALPPDDEPAANPDQNPQAAVDPANPPEPDKPNVPEGFEVREGWRAQPWGNPADVTLLKDDASGNQYLAVQMSGEGKESKTALGLRVNIAIVKSTKLIFNIYNPDSKPLPLSVAFNTSSDFYETRFIWIKKGWTEGVAVDLNASDFKCRATEWSHSSPMKGKEQVNNIMFLINERRKTAIYLDYVRFE